jgi:lysine-specific demethylase 8
MIWKRYLNVIRNQINPVQIATSSINSVKEWEDIVNRSQPIIFKNLASHWPAVSDSSRCWQNLKLLSERVLDDTIVPIEIGSSYMDPNIQKQDILLKSYLQFLEKQTWQTRPEKDIPRVYLAQHQLNEIPVMKDDVQIPDICKTLKGHMYNSNIWFGGPQGTISPCHHDPFHNILVQIFGEKTVTLAAPSYTKEMYPAVGTVQKNTSLIDFDSPDYKKHPLFQDVELFQVTLMAGDALYIPFKWWHHCKTNAMSCSVNFWWL